MENWSFYRWVFSIIAVALIATGLIWGLVLLNRQLAYSYGWASQPAVIHDAERTRRVRTDLIKTHAQLQSFRSQIEGMDARIREIEERNAHYTDTRQWSQQDRNDRTSLLRSHQDLVSAYNRQCADYNASWQNEYDAAVAENLRKQLPTKCDPITIVR